MLEEGMTHASVIYFEVFFLAFGLTNKTSEKAFSAITMAFEVGLRTVFRAFYFLKSKFWVRLLCRRNGKANREFPFVVFFFQKPFDDAKVNLYAKIYSKLQAASCNCPSFR